jgi:hypothetical protein
MTFTYQHDFRTFSAEIHRIGPAIQVVAHEGEFYASLAIGYMQSGDSTAVISKWEVDGPAKCEQLTGTNADWDRYWSAFLAILPKGLAEVVASFEERVRY